MLGVVLPAIATTTGRPIRNAVATVNISVTVEIVVRINGDIVVAPPAVIAPAAAPSRTHRNADTKRNRHTRGVIAGWWISNRRVRVDRRSVHHCGVITRDVNNFRTRLLDYDYLFALYRLSFDFLLIR